MLAFQARPARFAFTIKGFTEVSVGVAFALLTEKHYQKLFLLSINSHPFAGSVAVLFSGGGGGGGGGYVEAEDMGGAGGGGYGISVVGHV